MCRGPFRCKKPFICYAVLARPQKNLAFFSFCNMVSQIDKNSSCAIHETIASDGQGNKAAVQQKTPAFPEKHSRLESVDQEQITVNNPVKCVQAIGQQSTRANDLSIAASNPLVHRRAPHFAMLNECIFAGGMQWCPSRKTARHLFLAFTRNILFIPMGSSKPSKN